jgi:hypothetical protein
MKNKFILGILVLGIFISSVSIPAYNLKAQSVSSISQLIELLITIGAIAPDKAVSARAVGLELSSKPITPVSTTHIISTSTSYLQVLAPNGAEKWEMDLDLPYSITWGSAGLKQVNVALVSTAKNSSICNLNQSPVNSKDGNNTFKILLKTAKCYNSTTGSSTPLLSGTYKVRVYYSDSMNNTVKDESNATFTILPIPNPSMKVTYPNGGEQLLSNSTYNIKYTLKDTTDGKTVYLDLVNTQGQSVYNSRKITSKGIYELKIPSSVSVGAYKVKLSTIANNKGEIEDTSDNFFWISSK